MPTTPLLGDKLSIPKKEVDQGIYALQTRLTQVGLPLDAATAIIDAMSELKTQNDLPKWLEVERWAQRWVDKFSGAQDFDCYVDPMRATDLTARRFASVAEAINNMMTAGFTTYLRIGMIPNGQGTAAKDTTGTPNGSPTVMVIKTVNGEDQTHMANHNTGAIWDVNGNRHTFAAKTLILDGITLQSATALTTSWFNGLDSAEPYIWARNCYFDSGPMASASAAFRLTSNDAWLEDCTLFDTTVTGSSWLHRCRISGNAVTTNFSIGPPDTGYAIFQDCMFQPSTGVPTGTYIWTFPGTTNVIGNCIVTVNGPNIGSNFGYQNMFTFTGSEGNNYVTLNSGGLAIGASAWNQQCSINWTGANARGGYFAGQFGRITLPGKKQLYDPPWVVQGSLFAGMDITGPAVIDVGISCQPVVTGVIALTVRGDGVVGQARISTPNGGDTLINYIGATHSVIMAECHQRSIPGTNKAYAFDATSSRNILVVSGTDLMGSVGTDAGTNNRVITETGSPGIDTTAIHTGDTAGGQLSGTYPNPNVPARAGIDTTAVHTGDAAGGDLSGTYPNPTVTVTPSAVEKNWKQEFQGAYARHTFGARTTVGGASAIPVITRDAEGKVTSITTASPTDSSAVHSGDAAGGDLSGTYPNPTVQHQTFLKDWAQEFQGGFGKKQFPAPTSSTTPTGSAGGDLAGTYPNPTVQHQTFLKDFAQEFQGAYQHRKYGGRTTVGSSSAIPVITYDAEGNVTGTSTAAPTDASAIHSGDAAGGGLGGTYPNPTVTAAAGLDTSAIHTGSAAGGDLSGTYPNPSVQHQTFLKDFAQEFQGSYKKQSFGVSPKAIWQDFQQEFQAGNGRASYGGQTVSRVFQDFTHAFLMMG